MRNRYLIILLGSILFLLNACGPTTQTVSMHAEYANIYVGRTYNEILLALGAPDRETSDGADGNILIYEETVAYTVTKATKENVNTYSGTYVPGSRSQTTTSSSYLHLFINKDRICYNLKTNHTKVVSTKSSRQELAEQALQEFRLSLSPEELEKFDSLLAKSVTSPLSASFTMFNSENFNLLNRYSKFSKQYIKSHRR